MHFEDLLTYMNSNFTGYGEAPPRTEYNAPAQLTAQSALLDTIFPGFSLLSTAVYKYTAIDLSIYIPIFLALGLTIFCCKYVSTWVWDMIESYLMSTADVRVDDEMYNMVMAWVAKQKFSLDSRRFVANTNLNSRTWVLWGSFQEEEAEQEENIDFDAEGNPFTVTSRSRKQRSVRFTPSFGTHYFWHKGRLLLFKRSQNTRNLSFGPVSEMEEISISCFGRNPTALKALLDECRDTFAKNDENRTIIYRGGLKPGSAEPTWTRCVSRVSRPFSTVVLDEEVKKNILDDMRDYLHPGTRRWYSNRGIPYRRGYMLYGPAGTGKSSLSFALSGYFGLSIYIVSLNNPAMSEENLGTLFTELPKQCVVLLEDIDTAGLTHTRDQSEVPKPVVNTSPSTTSTNPANPPAPVGGRISLSALLNILDGVASQEGRVLIMTTNHIDKLDDALIRPGRVDMMVKFDLANAYMIRTIFTGIYATLEGDMPAALAKKIIRGPKKSLNILSKRERAAEEERLRREEDAKEETEKERRKLEEQKVEHLAEEISKKIPAMTFSPAEIQGYLLKHKRAPEKAVEQAEAWVKKTLEDKIKEKEKKAREEKERIDKEKKEKEEEEANKKKEEEEEKQKLKEEKALVNGVKD